jgi:hypothetical protein
MPGGNFDSSLQVSDGPDKKADGTSAVKIVKAGGPLDPAVAEVVELCVWVFQRADVSKDDAIANAMGPEGTRMDGMDSVTVTGKGASGAHWKMSLEDREGTGEVDFVAGSATAIAIGAFLVNESGGQRRRAFVWSEPVTITT